MSALILSPKGRDGQNVLCDFCAAKSARHRVEILDRPTGKDGKHEYACRGCALEFRKLWDEAAGVLELI